MQNFLESDRGLSPIQSSEASYIWDDGSSEVHCGTHVDGADMFLQTFHPCKRGRFRLNTPLLGEWSIENSHDQCQLSVHLEGIAEICPCTKKRRVFQYLLWDERVSLHGASKHCTEKWRWTSGSVDSCPSHIEVRFSSRRKAKSVGLLWWDGKNSIPEDQRFFT